MSNFRHREAIRFVEAGAAFELYGEDESSNWWIAVTPENGEMEVVEAENFRAACKAVDEWLDRNVGEDDRRFKGFVMTEWDHELHFERTKSYPTRGTLLEWFDDGKMPTIPELIELAEITCDRIMEVRDNAGKLVIDRREEVMNYLVSHGYVEPSDAPISHP
jgi:hypothetical protein